MAATSKPTRNVGKKMIQKTGRSVGESLYKDYKHQVEGHPKYGNKTESEKRKGQIGKKIEQVRKQAGVSRLDMPTGETKQKMDELRKKLPKGEYHESNLRFKRSERKAEREKAHAHMKKHGG